jgi:hypothetical protein
MPDRRSVRRIARGIPRASSSVGVNEYGSTLPAERVFALISSSLIGFFGSPQSSERIKNTRVRPGSTSKWARTSSRATSSFEAAMDPRYGALDHVAKVARVSLRAKLVRRCSDNGRP